MPARSGSYPIARRAGEIERLRIQATAMEFAACRRHLADPDTVFTSFLTAQVWGRKPFPGDPDRPAAARGLGPRGA